MEPELIDEIDCGSFFNQIDDLIEFPPDNECGDGNLVSSSDCKDFPTWDGALQDFDPLFFGSHGSTASDLAADLSVPYEDIVQLEWLSTFVEESFSGLGQENLGVEKDSSHSQFQSSSPVSVVRARSKRPRPATFNPRPAIQLISPASDNFAAESEQKKKSLHDEPSVRKCLHCEITKTPQWRGGPMGPKTLCNACGVRYKSGRLFPQYRPAASPTFIPSLHSNSHKKLLQMRVQQSLTLNHQR